MTEDQANLLSGILLGNIGLDPQFKLRLANAGLTHVVAASGMNISILSGFILSLLSKISMPKTLKALIAAGFVLYYASLTGFAPPIVRATIMFLFSIVAGLLGRQSSGFVGLMVAALLMLWVSPKLITDPSFLLSFTSMVGQIYLGTVKLNLPKIPALIIENFLQSLLILLFTLPIVVIFFAKFSLVSIFTNILVLWTVEPLMILGGVEIALRLFFTEAIELVTLPASGLLAYFLWVVDFFGRSNWSVVRFSLTPGLPTALFILGYYFILCALLIKVHERISKHND
ncbi:ComEC/Rec2 family competence protein [Candidatus Gottesmanbacteria bacterium]|nr:ComEC/Rec2 family competence protein [Candidatus Gottesmanbacteria bacterium]